MVQVLRIQLLQILQTLQVLLHLVPIIDPKSGKLVNSYITDNPTDNGLSGGSFDMKTTRDTTLENIGSSLDSLTTMGKDYTNILNPTGYQDTPSGTIIRRGDPSDPYGYGYVTSA